MKLLFAAVIAALLVLLPATLYAQEDLRPPTLLDVTFEPETFDTSKGPQTVTVTVHVTDDLSGVEWVAMGFRKPGTTQGNAVDIVPGSESTELLDGDHLDGRYRATMTLPQYAAYGAWEMYQVVLVDNVGNRAEMRKPDDAQEAGRGNDEWPSLFNGFTFKVAAAGVGTVRLFLPALAR